MVDNGDRINTIYLQTKMSGMAVSLCHDLLLSDKKQSLEMVLSALRNYDELVNSTELRGAR
jgi:hypothetical protein